MKNLDTSEQTVVAVYDNFSDAESAVQALIDEGFPRADVQLNPESDSSRFAQDDSKSVKHNDKKSSSGLSGFFDSLFSNDDETYRHAYSESVRRGSYVLTVNAPNEQNLQRASEIMNQFNPVDIDERTSHWKQQGWTKYDESAPLYSRDEIEKERASYASLRQSGLSTGTASAPSIAAHATDDNTTDQTRIPIIEEQLQVGKREVQRGGVRVFQRVRETPVHESVTLRDETISVQRNPVDRRATEADLANFKEGSMELRERDEEAVVSKTARVVEEVVVGKQVSERTQEINDTVRRTDVDVERLGAADSGRGTATTTSNLDDNDFRHHWVSTYGTSGGSYEDYDEAYRYGTTAAGSQRFNNYRWEDAEPTLRADWERSHPAGTWEKVKHAVRYGVERVSGTRH